MLSWARTSKRRLGKTLFGLHSIPSIKGVRLPRNTGSFQKRGRRTDSLSGADIGVDLVIQ